MKAAILVVDDDEVMRQTLSDVLKKRGYGVSTAETGGQTLSYIKDKPFDLVLLDIRLPDMDGLDVLKRIKELDGDLMVIVMTAYSDVQTAVTAMKSGAYHYIDKPFELEELKILIQKALETQSLRNEIRRLQRQKGEKHQDIEIDGNSPLISNVNPVWYVYFVADTKMFQGQLRCNLHLHIDFAVCVINAHFSPLV